MTNPIIPWLGGKRRLADKLIPLFPKHECYVEVFCGGAALYFLRPYPAATEVINDINGELVNLYRVVQHHLEEFVRQFKWALSSREVFKWQKEAKPETLTDIQRAARFYYLQQHAFGGKVSTGIILPMLIAGDILAVAYYHRHADWPGIRRLQIGRFNLYSVLFHMRSFFVYC